MTGDIITLCGIRYRIVESKLVTAYTAKGVAFKFTAIEIKPV